MADIVGAICCCATETIRALLIDLVSGVLAKLPLEETEGILGQLIAYVQTDTDVVLRNWRYSFDIFRIFTEFGTVDDFHPVALLDADFPGILEDFVSLQIPRFVANPANEVSQERFCRGANMTALLVAIARFDCDSKKILSRECMKWFVGGEFHSRAFVDLVLNYDKNAIPTIDRLLERAEAVPSEFLLAELLTFPQFQCPNRWLTNYFSETARQKHLLRAIGAKLSLEPEQLAGFTQRHKNVLTHLLFSSISDVREEAIAKFFREIWRRLDNPASILFPLIDLVPNLSTTLYASNADYKLSFLPRDLFTGLQLLSFLVEVAKETPQLQTVVGYVENNLHSLVDMHAVSDMHVFPLTLIGCYMMQQFMISARFLTDIQTGLTKMIRHPKELDVTLKEYAIALCRDTSRSAEAMLPDNELKGALIAAWIETGHEQSKPDVTAFFRSLSGRRAAAERVVRFLSAELPRLERFDGRMLIDVLSAYPENAIIPYITAIASNPKLFPKICAIVLDIRPADSFYPAAIGLLSLVIDRGVGFIGPVFNDEPRLFGAFTVAVADVRLPAGIRKSALKVLRISLERCDTMVPRFTAAPSSYQVPELEDYAVALIRKLQRQVQWPPPLLVQLRGEIVGTIRAIPSGGLALTRTIADLIPVYRPEWETVFLSKEAGFEILAVLFDKGANLASSGVAVGTWIARAMVRDEVKQSFQQFWNVANPSPLAVAVRGVIGIRG
jgi:hypothetical protein